METLTALTLTLPLLGFSASAAPSQPALLDSTLRLGLQPLELALAVDGEELAEGEGADEPAEDASEAQAAGADDEKQYIQLLRERAEIAQTHKKLGIATWVAMTATVILGGIQYHNLYGFFADQASNPCVKGTAIFGQGQCSGTPWLHLGSAAITTALYTATFAYSLAMPDPDDADEGDSDYAENLRLHKLLRWVHLGGMVAQALLGVVVANGESFGLNRTENYGALQALSTVHMVTGLVTYGALTWAGATMVF